MSIICKSLGEGSIETKGNIDVDLETECPVKEEDVTTYQGGFFFGELISGYKRS